MKFDLSSPIIMPKGGENKSDMSYLVQNFEAQFGKLVRQEAISVKVISLDGLKEILNFCYDQGAKEISRRIART